MIRLVNTIAFLARQILTRLPCIRKRHVYVAARAELLIEDFGVHFIDEADTRCQNAWEGRIAIAAHCRLFFDEFDLQKVIAACFTNQFYIGSRLLQSNYDWSWETLTQFSRDSGLGTYIIDNAGFYERCGSLDKILLT